MVSQLLPRLFGSFRQTRLCVLLSALLAPCSGAVAGAASAGLGQTLVDSDTVDSILVPSVAAGPCNGDDGTCDARILSVPDRLLVAPLQHSWSGLRHRSNLNMQNVAPVSKM